MNSDGIDGPAGRAPVGIGADGGGRMPRQNRVTPFGEIVAVPQRGTVMGNRGRLHDEAGRIRRPWQVKRWLLCRLEFHGRHRVVMAPNRYTELFFLDEATGLASGHRPCSECRRKSFEGFAQSWGAGDHAAPGAARPKAAAIDDRLHEERVSPGNSQRTFAANLDGLPDGVFVTRGDGLPYLLRDGHLLAWSPGGYTGRLPRPHGEVVEVLTPRSTVSAIRAGYLPEVHPSAEGAGSRPPSRRRP